MIGLSLLDLYLGWSFTAARKYDSEEVPAMFAQFAI